MCESALTGRKKSSYGVLDIMVGSHNQAVIYVSSYQTLKGDPELFIRYVGIVTIDPQGIYRCLLNCVSNSIDACDNDGIVRLKTNILSQDNLLTVSVSDNGCGIS